MRFPRARHGARLLVLFSVISAATLALAGGHAHAQSVVWDLKEFQPAIAEGGRANTIAVHPTSHNIMIVATETGGLFRTVNGGITWKHIDTFRPHLTWAVAYVPWNPSVVIATAQDDFGANGLVLPQSPTVRASVVRNGGGIWLSTNGGATWTQRPDPQAPSGRTRFIAYEISFAPDTQGPFARRIYVASNYGIVMSTDAGVTWSTLAQAQINSARSVLAQAGGLLFAGDRFSRVDRSTDGGARWSSSPGPGSITDLHAFARSPYAPEQAYVVDDDTHLFVTENSGASWTRITTPPQRDVRCGGIAFIKAARWNPLNRGARPHLYFGNRCGLYRQLPPNIAGTGRYDYSGTWTTAALDHDDTRDIGFATGSATDAPLLLATDGGVHRTPDGGGRWELTGGGANGFNALQITELKGQRIDDPLRHDLYFSAWDNGFWASEDGGGEWSGRLGGEGFYINMLNRVAHASDSRVTFHNVSAGANWISGRLYKDPAVWKNPPWGVGSPTTIAQLTSIQSVQERPVLSTFPQTGRGFAAGFAVTRDLGATWNQYAVFPEQPASDLVKLARPPKNVVKMFWRSVQYQAIRIPSPARYHLVRMSLRPDATAATVSYPAMNGFGGVGVIYFGHGADYRVFAVDPSDYRYLLGSDVINRKMMRSTDAGQTWSEIPALTALVTDGGRFQFNNEGSSHASAISFYPGDPNRVAVGTMQAGIFISTDHGTSWAKVKGSERVPFVTGLEWRNGTDLLVSTFGRGLWRVRGTMQVPKLPDLICAFVDCHIRFLERGRPPPDRDRRGIVVFEGHVQGLRVDASARVREIFVSPGSSMAFFGVPGVHGAPPGLVVTESREQVGLRGRIAGLDAWPKEAGVTAGFLLDRRDRVIGLVGAKEDLPLSLPDNTAELAWQNDREVLERRSPTADRPYLTLKTGPGSFVAPGALIEASGVRFPPGGTMEFLIDARAVATTVVTRQGTFALSLKAPKQPDRHELIVRDVKYRTILDGSSFNVMSGDEGAEQRKRARPSGGDVKR